MMNDEQLKKLQTLGAMCYSFSRCAFILEIEDLKKFKKEFYDEKSPVFKAYWTGRYLSEFKIDSSIYKMAEKAENAEAIEAYEDMVYKRKKEYEQEYENRNEK